MAKIKCTDKFGREYEFEESEYTYRKSVYGLAINRDQVLMIMDPRSDKWELPGGGVDEGETDSEALKREFIEETGLKLSNKEPVLLDESLNNYYALGEEKPWKSHRFYYKVELSGEGKILDKGNGDDTQAAKFIDLKELASLPLAKKDLDVINSAK